jgi:hypothetical protein
MNSYLGKPSLIPYLKPTDAMFYLKLSMTVNASPYHKKSGFPFFIRYFFLAFPLNYIFSLDLLLVRVLL